MRKSGKPQVLFYAPTPPPFAGPEVASSLLLDAFKGNKVRLTHLRSNVREENWEKGIFDLKGTIRFCKVYRNFLYALLKEKPDKVYFLLSGSPVGFLRDALIVFTTKLSHKKAVAHYRGGNFHNFYKQHNALFRWFIRLTFKNIDCLIVQAEILKSIFEGLFPNEKMHVLYNGMKLNDNNPKFHHNGDNPFTILFIGHLAFSKGFYELIQAFLKLRRKHRVRLLFAGAYGFFGKKRESIRGALSDEKVKFFDAHALRIEQVISEFINCAGNYDAHYLGIINGRKKAKSFQEADVFVLPSYSEGFSVSILEAMANGLPVVVTPVGAAPEFLKEGVNGYFVQPGNSRDLEEKLEMLLLNREKARTIGENNRHYVAERFSIEQIAQQFENILEGA